jgi:MazG family protein
MGNNSGINRLRDILKALRTPETGCPWDLKQDFKSIAAYTIEEAYEVVDAIERDDMDDLKDELGDLLLQVVFHARMAEEAGLFDFNDVAHAISDKMQRRHPHVFADEAAKSADEVKNSWEVIKAKEKLAKSGTKPQSLLEDIPNTLPGMTRSVKLQKRAAGVGFDWPEISQVFDKLDEELNELREEIKQNGSSNRLLDEMGDVMFVIANLARHLKVDPEQAARAGNQKFTRRFSDMEKQAQVLGKDMNSLTLAELEAMWQAAKTKGL